MDGLLGAPIPEERQADCGRCPMRLPAGGVPEPGAVYFGEGKCCTYQPQLHGFHVGAILADPSGAGRDVLERLLASRAGVTPLGAFGARAYWLLYDGGDAFGRSTRLRCPFFDVAGGCGIWSHRESTCATWFCKHERGALGGAFWNAAARLLRHLERSLDFWCALELGVECDALEACAVVPPTAEAEDVDGGASDERFRAVWGRWLGREREYYLACAERVEALGWPEVLALGGAEGRAMAASLRTRFEALREERLPGVLRVGAFRVAGVTQGHARLHTYRGYDPLDVPLALLNALPRFDGRPTAEVVAEIAALDGVQVGEDVLRTLVDFEVLKG